MEQMASDPGHVAVLIPCPELGLCSPVPLDIHGLPPTGQGLTHKNSFKGEGADGSLCCLYANNFPRGDPKEVGTCVLSASMVTSSPGKSERQSRAGGPRSFHTALPKHTRTHTQTCRPPQVHTPNTHPRTCTHPQTCTHLQTHTPKHAHTSKHTHPPNMHTPPNTHSPRNTHP